VAGSPTRLGLRANLTQFSLLLAVNLFVGAMVGLAVATAYLPSKPGVPMPVRRLVAPGAIPAR
jgi:hypothetical protein